MLSIWHHNTIWCILTAIAFPPSDSGNYTCTQKEKNSNIHKEKKYRSHNTQNRKQIVQNNKIKIKRITTFDWTCSDTSRNVLKCMQLTPGSWEVWTLILFLIQPRNFVSDRSHISLNSYEEITFCTHCWQTWVGNPSSGHIYNDRGNTNVPQT